jgi:hypothetical protein
MDKGCFLMGTPRGRKKHLCVVISDPTKYGGCGVIVNLSTDRARSGGECFLARGDHPWLTEPQSWVCFNDALLMSVSGWNEIQTGIDMGLIIPTDKMSTQCVDKIIAAAKASRLFHEPLLKYLD